MSCGLRDLKRFPQTSQIVFANNAKKLTTENTEDTEWEKIGLRAKGRGLMGTDDWMRCV